MRRVRDTTAAILALTLAVAPQARAADADATAVERGDQALYIGGSATYPNDARSSIVGRWSPASGAFDWLWRIDEAPLAADAVTDLVAANGSLYAVGSANGRLSVAKLDPATGTLQRSCDGDGLALPALDAAVLPGRAVALGGDIAVVGGTLSRPTRGFIALIDGQTCALRRAALVAPAETSRDAGFTAVDADGAGALVVSGFVGTDAAVLRFTPEMRQLALRTVDLGGPLGEVFGDVRVRGGQVVAAAGGVPVVQCFALPALDPGCRTPLTFAADGTAAGLPALAPLPDGNWLVGGAHTGKAGFPTVLTRAALATFTGTALERKRVFDPFAYMPSGFAALTASASGLAGVGASGYFPARTPFLFTSAPDGTNAGFVPLKGFDAAGAVPVEPAPAAPPQATAPAPRPAARPATKRSRLAAGRFRARRAKDGTFATLTLRCRSACTARGTYRASGAKVGATIVRLAAGRVRTIRLRLSAAGRRRIARAGRLRVTVRFTVRAADGRTQTLSKRMSVSRTA